MRPALRKLTLTAHVVSSVGWLGAVIAYLALAIAALSDRALGAYPSLELIAWFVLLPLSLASLIAGLVQSFGTEWGLFRHYWIAVKFCLTVPATIILIAHLPAISRMAREPLIAPELLPLQLVLHAAGGLTVLLAATAISIYKPWGRLKTNDLQRR